MSIFKKAPAKELPPLFTEAELNEGAAATYEQVLDFLVSVNDSDYKKVIKVADAYRKTHCEVAKITGIEQEPVGSIFETQTQTAQPVTVTAPATDTEAGNFLDGDDDLAAAFLDDDEPAATNQPKSTKVTVKDDNANHQS